MAWTYSQDPSSSARDEIRFLTGDTDKTRPWTIQDGEIDYAVSLYSLNPPVTGKNFRAALECANAIVAKLVRLMSLTKSVGDLSLSVNTGVLTTFQDNAKRLERLATLQAVKPYFGGTSYADKDAANQDTDRVRPVAEVDGMKIGGPQSGFSSGDNNGP
jgi:hypothetical protein